MSANLLRRFSRLITVLTDAEGGQYDSETGYYQPGELVPVGVPEEELENEDVDTARVSASVQPMTAKDLLLLPEGDRSKEWRKLYSTYEFKVQRAGVGADAGKQYQSDVCVIDGKRFVVMAVTDWVMPGQRLRYFRADAVLENENTNDLPPPDPEP